MGKIALIQSQVYMSYSTKSDIRPLLVNLDLIDSEDIILYTAHNIQKLKFDLTDLDVSAVIFTSNSLSEQTIKREVESEPFKQLFESFLAQGKGCLVLHQLNSIPKEFYEPYSALNFLPLEAPRSVRRKEEATKGNIKSPRLAETHPIFHYPNNVSLEELKKYCVRKKGLYWHYLEDSHLSTEWETLLYDEDENKTRRVLLLSTRETSKYRIVISSLNLDWQKETTLLKNLLKYMIDGKCNTAIIKDSSYKNLAFEFFLETLNSLNYRYQEYDLSNASKIEELKNQIIQGTHSIVVLGPTIRQKEEILHIEQFLQPFIDNGKIKYIGVNSNEMSLKQFFVAGREKSALRILQDTEIKIHSLLKEKKLIDGSFWNSVDTLKVHKALEEDNVSYTTFTAEMVQPILDSVTTESYNGLLVPTSALLWLRATYGTNQGEYQKTVDWMKKTLQSGEEAESECIVAYNTFLELEMETEMATDQLKKLISDKDLSSYNEIEIIHYIKAAILLRDIELIKQFVTVLESKKNLDNLWIDISVSATIVNLLLEALVILKDNEKDTKSFEKTIEDLVFPTIIIMQKVSKQPSAGAEMEFAWDNKANTTLKCVSAILNFEELMDIPVTEMVQSLISYSQSSNQILDNKAVFKVIEDYRNEISVLTKKKKELENQVNDERKRHQQIEEEKQLLQKRNQRLESQNDEYEEQIRKGHFQLNFWKIVISLGIVSIIILIFLSIYMYNHPSVFKDIISFYKNYYLVEIISTILSLLMGVTATSFFRKKVNTKKQKVSERGKDGLK